MVGSAGLGQSALFPLALTLIVLRGGTVASTAGLSTLVQSVGYVLAAFVPLALGALHDATGSWTTPVVVLLALLLPQTLGGLIAGRSGQVIASARDATLPVVEPEAATTGNPTLP